LTNVLNAQCTVVSVLVMSMPFGAGLVQYWNISEAHRSKHSLCACQPE